MRELHFMQIFSLLWQFSLLENRAHRPKLINTEGSTLSVDKTLTINSMHALFFLTPTSSLSHVFTGVPLANSLYLVILKSNEYQLSVTLHYQSDKRQ